MTAETRREAIRTYCAARRIDTLVHFTRLENLAGILTEGILPRLTLEERSVQVIFNDAIRMDRHRDATCLKYRVSELPNILQVPTDKLVSHLGRSSGPG